VIAYCGSSLAAKRLRFLGQHRRKRNGSVEERRSDFVAPIFAKCDLDDVGQSITIENCADGISNVEHQHSQPAMNFIRARAASVGCLANASDRRQRSVDRPNDSAKFDLVHRPRERIAAEFSASACHVSRGFELRENLFQEFDRQLLL